MAKFFTLHHSTGVQQGLSKTAALYLPPAACLLLFFLPASACSPLHRGRGVQIVYIYIYMYTCMYICTYMYIYTSRGNFIGRGVWRRGGLLPKKRPWPWPWRRGWSWEYSRGLLRVGLVFWLPQGVSTGRKMPWCESQQRLLGWRVVEALL